VGLAVVHLTSPRVFTVGARLGILESETPMSERRVRVVPSGEFRANPAQYLGKVDQEPVSLRSSDGRVFVTIGGLVDLDEPEEDEEAADRAPDAAAPPR